MPEEVVSEGCEGLFARGGVVVDGLGVHDVQDAPTQHRDELAAGEQAVVIDRRRHARNGRGERKGALLSFLGRFDAVEGRELRLECAQRS